MVIDDIVKIPMNQIKLNSLVEQCKYRNVVPFIGSGMTVCIYGLWKDTAIKWIQEYIESEIDREKAMQYIWKNEYSLAITKVKEYVGEVDYELLVKEEFSFRKLNNVEIKNMPIYLLKDIFGGTVITTNLDKTLEKEVYPGNPIYTLNQYSENAAEQLINKSIRENKSCVIKIHGDVEDATTWILNDKDYANFYRENGVYIKLIEKLMESKVILTLGASLDKDRPVEILKNVSQYKGVENYAILQIPSDDEEFQRRRKELSDSKIKVIWYPKEDTQHESVKIILEYLRDNLVKVTKREASAKVEKDMESKEDTSVPRRLKKGDERYNFHMVKELVEKVKKTYKDYDSSWLLENMDKIIKNSCNALFVTKTKWGPTKNNEVKKIANISEGLMAVLSASKAGYQFSSSDQVEIKKVIDELITLGNTEGYVSYNIDKYTTTCTGMALYIIKKFEEEGWILLRKEEKNELYNMACTLLENASEWGWGNENKKIEQIKLTRMLSTIWALRALNVWGFSSNDLFKKIIFNLLHKVPNGEFGFCVESKDKKTSMIALFLILIKEIRNQELANEVIDKLGGKNIRNLIIYLVEDLSTDVETEDYLIDLEYHKKLPWTHLSSMLALSAISNYEEYLSNKMLHKVMKRIREIVEAQFDEEGFYICEKLNSIKEDPFMYPTAYAIMGMSDFKNNILKKSK